MYKILLFSFSLFLLGCSTATTQLQPTQYEKESSARLRAYGMNTLRIIVYPNLDGCPKDSDSENAIRISGKIGQSLKSLFSAQDNISIGIPLKENTHNKPSMGKEFYTETVIPANKPVTIFTSFGESHSGGGWAYSTYCKPLTATFYPEAGKDYETYLQLTDTSCVLKLVRIESDGNIFNDVNKTIRKECTHPRSELLHLF